MKNYVFAALAAVPCIVSVAPAATVEEVIGFFEKQLDLVKEAASVLEGAKDKATADAAAAQMQKIVNEMQKNERAAKALGELTPEQKAEAEKILSTRKDEMMQTAMPFAMQMLRLTDADFYGSADLKQIMGKLAEVEEKPGM